MGLNDAIWLASILEAAGDRLPYPIVAPAVALRDDTAVGPDPAFVHALRPLRQFDSRPVAELDEERTARHAIGTGVWLPLSTFRRQLRQEAVVVVDDSASMEVWADEVAGFVALLRGQGLFRAVRVCRFATDCGDKATVMLQGGATLQGYFGDCRTRATSVFVLTDGVAPAWRAGAVLPHLYRWACRQQVAVIHLLPQQLWHRTGLAPHRLRLRAARPGLPNVRMRYERHRTALPAFGDTGIAVPGHTAPVPVLELRPNWLAAWIRLVIGRQEWVSLPAVLATAESTAEDPPLASRSALDGSQRVREFISWATPTALALATRLAAAPLQSVVIRVVREELVPDARTFHLAEVLASDLVRPARHTTDLGQPRFDFWPGVREELLAAGRRAETLRVWRVLQRRLGATFPAASGLDDILDRPDETPMPAITPSLEPLLRIERSVLHALSGRYLPRARRLDEMLDAAAAATQDGMIRTSASVRVDEKIRLPQAVDPVGDSGSEGGAVASHGSVETVPPLQTPAIWGNIPPRNPNFTGRAELLESLHRQIRAGPTAVLPHALHGMGGVGKSHLAIEYVYQHQGEYDLIWWIPAERSTQIGSSLVELAQRMNLTAGPDVSSARDAVLEALRISQPYMRWLLVFDNAESPESLAPYLPTNGTGNVMITSRNPQWTAIARTLEVDVFTRAESVQLLRRRGPDLEDRQADQLAEALGDLPLALEQAAAWRAETGMPAEEYLKLFDEKRVELLEQAPPMDYQLPVAAAWNVSLDRLVVSNPAAFRLLQLCSFLAPEPIPRTLFIGAKNNDIHSELNAALRDPMRLNRAIRDINRYALARIIHRTNSIQMHRLIQAVLIDRMTESERNSMRHSAHLLLASGDRNDPDSPTNWRSYADLYPHVMVSEALHSTEPWVQQLVQNEAKYLYWWGDFEASLELAQQAYESWRAKLGEDASATLTIGHWLGFMLFRAGRYNEATEHNARIVESYQRTTTEDTEEVLRAIGAVAADLRLAGKFIEALAVDEDLYRRHVRALGEEDPNTLNAAHNLAVSLRLVGDIKRAYEVDKATYEHRVLLFGEDHAHTLESHLNLIIDRRELGEYLPALAELQNIVNRIPQIWGSAQTQMLTAKRRLASALRKAGDHEAARVLSQEVRSGFAARYGENHPDALLAAFGLAVDLRATTQLDAASDLSREIIDSYRKLLGEAHPYTIAAHLNAAIIYRQQGDLRLARETNERGLKVLTRSLGEDHPLALAGKINLGNDVYAQKDFSAAYELDSNTAERTRHVFGEEHPTTLICLGNLAMDLIAIGRSGEAYELHAEISPKFLRSLGAEHPATRAGTDLTVRGDCDLDPMPL